jgi:cytochrome c553
MMRIGAIVLAVICFVLGALAQRTYDAHRPSRAAAVLHTEASVPQQTPAPAASAPPPVPVPFASIQFDHEPVWAYGFDRAPQPGEKAAPQAAPNRNLRTDQSAEEQTRPRQIAGSRATFSLQQIRDGQNVVDWFPEDHPPMPDVIAHGPVALGNLRRGCAQCHLPNGKGRPENAQPGGLPASYIVRQIEDFRAGLRYTADPRKPNTNTMIQLAKAMSDEELKQASEYFSSIPFTPWVRVVETDLVPKTHIEGNLFLPLEQTRTEPIAGRIIEVPENQEQSETYRNPHSGFVAYVPTGSIERGKDLVTTGGMHILGNQIVPGRTTACVTCHGPDLMGVGDVPPIAGRSPSYIVRQLWDIQQGTRRGALAQLMKMVVANLNEQDFVNIAAYVASRPPAPAAASAPVARGP